MGIRSTCLAVLSGLCLAGIPLHSPWAAERAPHYQGAVERAKATGADLFIFEHGSDWCPLGEKLKADVWDTEAFAEAMGKDAILLDIDFPEDPAAGLAAMKDKVLALRSAAYPPVKVLDIKGLQGTKFKHVGDGSWLVDGGAKPSDDYVLTLAASTETAAVLVVEALADASLPCRGPGCASNGNFVLNEVDLSMASGGVTQHVTLDAAWADVAAGNDALTCILDGTRDPGKFWQPEAHARHEDRILALTPHAPIPAGTALTVKLMFYSQWGQHSIGRVRVRLVPGMAAADAVRALYGREVLRCNNAAFGLRTWNFPAVAMLDASNRFVHVVEPLRLGLDAAKLATRLLEAQAARKERDRVWDQAKTAQTGTARAELLGKGLDLMECKAGWFSHGNVYRPQYDELKKHDPQDTTGYQRKFECNPWGASWAKMHTLMQSNQFAEALAIADQELAHPGNRRLAASQKQELFLPKYFVYKRWKEQQEKMYDVLKAMRDVDPSSGFGIGAQGHILMHHKGPVTLTYGWAPEQLKEGRNTWEFAMDAGFYFDHAGAYELTVQRQGTAHGLTVRSARLSCNGREVSRDVHDAVLDPAHPNATYRLDLPERPADARIALRVEVETLGGCDSRGAFSVNPLLPPKPPLAPEQQ